MCFAAVSLLERFFGEEDDEDQNLAPQAASNGGFAFGLAKAPLAASAQPAFAF